MLILACYCVCSELLLPSTMAGPLRHNDDVSFWCHCSPAMSATLQSLSTVHSQQQECTPDRQECTVDSEASEA